jgi:hypothetical protein
MLKTVGNPSTRYGDQTIDNGSLVIATSGEGVDFSANTALPGATKEVLDWYEEGTYTATLTPGNSGSVTLKSGEDLCSYVRIGRMVTVTGHCGILSVSSPTGYIGVSLPYTIGNLPENAARGVGAVTIYPTALASPASFVSIALEGETILRVYLAVGTSISGGAEQLQADSSVFFTFTYFTS